MNRPSTDTLEIRPRRVRSIMWLLLYLIGCGFGISLSLAESGFFPSLSVAWGVQDAPNWRYAAFFLLMALVFGLGTLMFLRSSLGNLMATFSSYGVQAPNGETYSWSKSVVGLHLSSKRIWIGCADLFDQECEFKLNLDRANFKKSDLKAIEGFIETHAPELYAQADASRPYDQLFPTRKHPKK